LDEISELDDITARNQLSDYGSEKVKGWTPTRLRTWTEDPDEDLKKLQSQFGRYHVREDDTQAQLSEQPPRPLIDMKGKGKVSPSQGISEDDYPRLHQQWKDKYTDILGGTKEELPPWREVNHEIHLIDKNKRYTYHLPWCPHSLREEFHEKIKRYVNAGWWEP
jgi:hypothetical protein